MRPGASLGAPEAGAASTPMVHSRACKPPPAGLRPECRGWSSALRSRRGRRDAAKQERAAITRLPSGSFQKGAAAWVRTGRPGCGGARGAGLPRHRAGSEPTSPAAQNCAGPVTVLGGPGHLTTHTRGGYSVPKARATCPAPASGAAEGHVTGAAQARGRASEGGVRSGWRFTCAVRLLGRLVEAASFKAAALTMRPGNMSQLPATRPSCPHPAVLVTPTQAHADDGPFKTTHLSRRPQSRDREWSVFLPAQLGDGGPGNAGRSLARAGLQGRWQRQVAALSSGSQGCGFLAAPHPREGFSQAPGTVPGHKGVPLPGTPLRTRHGPAPSTCPPMPSPPGSPPGFGGATTARLPHY